MGRPKKEKKDIITSKSATKKSLNSLIQKASEYKEKDVKFKSTGILILDLILKCGGFREGRLVEIFGPEHSGKTLMSLLAIIHDQKMYGKPSLFVDAEASFDLKWFKTLGGDLNLLDVYNPYEAHEEVYGELIYNNIIELIKTNKYSFVVLDSLMGGALISKKILEKDLDDKKDASPGGNAKLNKAFFQRSFGNTVKTNTTFIITNHVVDKIGIAFGNPETTAGGRALKFFAEQRIQILLPSKKEQNVGHISRGKIIKNKRGNSAGQNFEYYLSYNYGVDNFGDMKKLLIEHGIINKKDDVEITKENYDEYKQMLLDIYNDMSLDGETDNHEVDVFTDDEKNIDDDGF